MINERLPNDGHSKPLHAIGARRIADVCAGAKLLALLLLVASDTSSSKRFGPTRPGSRSSY
jgi:hypothetical protein